MNKKASNILIGNVMQIILLAVFTAFLYSTISSHMYNAQSYEDMYAKETARLINLANPKDVIVINIQEISEIAKKNNLASFDDIMSYDNEENEVCYKLSQGRETCYPYFNDIKIEKVETKLAAPTNKLIITIQNDAE